MTPRQRRLALLLLLVGAAWPPTWAGDGIQLQMGRGNTTAPLLQCPPDPF